MIKSTIKTLLLLLLSAASFATDANMSFKEKIENLHKSNAPIDENARSLVDEFNKMFSYYDFLMQTTELYFSKPKFSDASYSDMVTQMELLEETLVAFYNSSDNDYRELLKQINAFLTSFSDADIFIAFIGLSLYQFEERLEWVLKQIRDMVEANGCDFVYQEISRGQLDEPGLQDDINKGLIPGDIRKDLLLRLLVKKVILGYVPQKSSLR